MALVTQREAPANTNLHLVICDEALQALHHALVRRDRREDAEFLRGIPVGCFKFHCQNQSGFCRQMRSTFPDFQKVQQIWLSLVNEDSFLSAAGHLIEEIHIQVCRLAYEPPAYGINPKAVEIWPYNSSLVKKSFKKSVEDSKVQSLPDPIASAMRPADTDTRSTTAKKRRTTKTERLVVKQEENQDERTTETLEYATWKKTEQGRDFDVSFEAFKSIKCFLGAESWRGAQDWRFKWYLGQNSSAIL
ncbi:hypothetical protein IWX90DRAFT_499355 [Phyllosticta citrichinensis]|uniref:Uncharacterized protein n=1 Tax=Phyllosticta citrichinensis TaxID=1130410 RepID=A0ABR1XZD4_9PEZI